MYIQLCMYIDYFFTKKCYRYFLLSEMLTFFKPSLFAVLYLQHVNRAPLLLLQCIA
jgi:hypothetical protein